MATISNTPRPAYAWDSTDNCWYPIGTGAHSHNEIDKTTINAKGDLIVGTANDAYTRQAVGADGSILVADSTQTTGVNWAGPSFIAGKNAVINSSFDIWQRGTSIAYSGGNQYTADRWVLYSGNTGRTVSRQASGLTGFQYCARVQRDSGNAGGAAIAFNQSIETVNTVPYAGKPVTISFWARKGANYSEANSNLEADIYYGTGTDQNVNSGYTGVASISANVTLTTSWQRFYITGTLPSTAASMAAYFIYTPTGTAGAADYFEVTGVQIETGALPTQHSRAGGSQQAELALCQRYYEKSYNDGVNPAAASDPGVVFGCRPNGGAYLYAPFKVTKRTTPTITVYSPATGTSGKVRNYNSAADETASTGFIGHNGFKTAGTTSSNDLLGLQFTADAEL